MKKFALVMGASAVVLAACGGSVATPDSSLVLQKNAALTTTTRPGRSATTLPVRTSTTMAAPASTTTASSPPPAGGCSNSGPCKVGQKGPAGGVVFYAAASPQAWGQYMEVRPDLFAKIVPDTCPLDGYDSYKTGELGDGAKQLAAVVKSCTANGVPTKGGSVTKVDEYAQNGYSDWFIPSKTELSELLKSKVLKFDSTLDLTSHTWVMKPADPAARSFDVLYGLKKETIASFNSGSTRVGVEIMSDGPQSYGNPNNRWGWFYVVRAFGPKAG